METSTKESYPVTDPFAEDRRNPAKKQKRVLEPCQKTIIINIKCYYYLYKRWKMYNDIELTKNTMNLNN